MGQKNKVYCGTTDNTFSRSINDNSVTWKGNFEVFISHWEWPAYLSSISYERKVLCSKLWWARESSCMYWKPILWATMVGLRRNLNCLVVRFVFSQTHVDCTRKITHPRVLKGRITLKPFTQTRNVILAQLKRKNWIREASIFRQVWAVQLYARKTWILKLAGHQAGEFSARQIEPFWGQIQSCSVTSCIQMRSQSAYTVYLCTITLPSDFISSFNRIFFQRWSQLATKHYANNAINTNFIDQQSEQMTFIIMQW